MINRAIELKSPSIQCHRFFHVASVTDRKKPKFSFSARSIGFVFFSVQALVPPDSKSNYDLHLEYSVRDLKTYRQNIVVDLIFLYPSEHIPTAKEIEFKVDPRKIKEYLSSKSIISFRFSSSNSLRTWIENLDTRIDERFQN